MSEMVERVYRAIARAGGDNPDTLPTNHGPGFGLRKMYEGMARAAIEAIREPTERMLSDADSAIPRAEIDSETDIRMMGREVALEAWRAMIDAALSSEKE